MKPSAVSWPLFGQKLQDQDAKQLAAFIKSLYAAMQEVEPNRMFLPYTTDVPTLTKNGQIVVYGTTGGGGTIYFMANSTTLKVVGTT